jgi:hypothetical protein
MLAKQYFEPLRQTPPADHVSQADRELLVSEINQVHRAGALRGLMFAIALAVPLWVAIFVVFLVGLRLLLR